MKDKLINEFLTILASLLTGAGGLKAITYILDRNKRKVEVRKDTITANEGELDIDIKAQEYFERYSGALSKHAEKLETELLKTKEEYISTKMLVQELTSKIQVLMEDARLQKLEKDELIIRLQEHEKSDG